MTTPAQYISNVWGRLGVKAPTQVFEYSHTMGSPLAPSERKTIMHGKIAVVGPATVSGAVYVEPARPLVEALLLALRDASYTPTLDSISAAAGYLATLEGFGHPHELAVEVTPGGAITVSYMLNQRLTVYTAHADGTNAVRFGTQHG